MARKLSLGFILLVFSCSTLLGQYNYEFNNQCKQAYSKIISLKFEEGKKLIEQEKLKNPNNNIPYLLENYIYFLTVFISEEEALFETLDNKKDDLIDRLEAGDKNSPYYRYCLAQVHLQWAVARSKFKEYVSATLEINRAYRMLEDNKEIFPDFLPHNINLGLLHTMIGTIPDNYNWVKRMVGIEGTVDEGVNEILEVLNQSMKNQEYSHYKAECLFYLSFIQMNMMTNKSKTLDYIRIIEQDKSSLENPLAIYAIARIYMSNGMNDKAIDLLVNRPQSQAYFPFYYLDYLTGLAKLHRLDDDASKYLFKYVINFKGTNYIKDAYQKIAWHYFVHGNTEKYTEYIAKVKKYGNTVVDADKQAEGESEKAQMPNPFLLRARLLFDGGYYAKAAAELTAEPKANIVRNENDDLEFTYRLGRIYHEWGKTEEGIRYYEQTIAQGANSRTYFAANSALQLGKIYEEQKKYELASRYYKAAQSMENTEYRNSINQKAKAGLNRVENRK